MKKKSVIFLGGGISQQIFIKSINDLGFKIILIDKDKYCPCKKNADIFFNIDLKNYKKIISQLDTIKRDYDFISSYAVADYAIKTLTKINDKFKIDGLKKNLINFFNNKEISKKNFINAGINVPKSIFYGNLKQFNFFIKKYKKKKKKIVIKCIDQNNSQGLAILNNPSISRINLEANHSFKLSKKIIIEEYLKGKTYSVDCIILNEKIKIISTSENIYNSKNKIENFYVIQPAKLKEKIINQLQNLIKKLFSNSATYKGPATIDFIISNKKIYFLEISPHFHSPGSEILRGNGNPLVDYIKCLRLNKIINFKRKPKKIITFIKKFKINEFSEIQVLLNKNLKFKENIIFYQHYISNQNKQTETLLTIIKWLKKV